MGVIRGGSPLQTLALPVFCAIAHAGARARQLLWDAGGVPLLVALLSTDLWRLLALNALGDWVMQEAERAKMQAVLLEPASQAALCSLLAAALLAQRQQQPAQPHHVAAAAAPVSAEAVAPQLLTLCDRCPRLARALAERAEWMAPLAKLLERCVVQQAVPLQPAGPATAAAVFAEAEAEAEAMAVSIAEPPAPGSLVLGEDARVVKLLLALLRAMFEAMRAGGSGPGEEASEAMRAWLLRWGLPNLVVRAASAARASGRVMLCSATDSLLHAFVAAVSAPE